MRRRPPRLIDLLPDEVGILKALIRDGSTPQRVAQRARILLAMSDPGTGVVDLGERLEADRSTVWRVCRRYEVEGLAALVDAPRSGRPRTLSPPDSCRDRTARLL